MSDRRYPHDADQKRVEESKFRRHPKKWRRRVHWGSYSTKTITWRRYKHPWKQTDIIRILTKIVEHPNPAENFQDRWRGNGKLWNLLGKQFFDLVGELLDRFFDTMTDWLNLSSFGPEYWQDLRNILTAWSDVQKKIQSETQPVAKTVITVEHVSSLFLKTQLRLTMEHLKRLLGESKEA